MILPMRILVFLGMAICLSGGSAFAAELTDDLGRSIELARAPMRVVSLAPAVTETVFAIGLGERLVGVSRYCDHPPAATRLPRVGGFSDPELERILFLAPDAVLVTSVVQEGIHRALRGAGIKVYTVFPRSVGGLAESIRKMGTFLGGENGANAVAERIDREFAGVRAAVADLPGEERVSVFFEVDPGPLVTVTSRSFEGSLIELAGGRNIAGELPKSYSRIDPEAVVLADPRVIVAAHERSLGVPHELRTGWESIDAVRRGRICADIDVDLLVRPGPRAVEGAWALLRCFYPERAAAIAGDGAEAP